MTTPQDYLKMQKSFLFLSIAKKENNTNFDRIWDYEIKENVLRKYFQKIFQK